MAGEPVGLDYAGVRAVAEARGVRWDAEMLRQISDFERGALEGFATLAKMRASGEAALRHE